VRDTTLSRTQPKEFNATEPTSTVGRALDATQPVWIPTKIQAPAGWITTKIQAKYFLDADVKVHRIDVDIRNGVVTLKGRVDNAQQKQEAEQIARETEGVLRVENQLNVASAGA
jgi:osmotically-inducible protein OsmY